MTEKEFLKQYDSSVYEKPSVAVDLLVFTIEDDRLKILLTKRDGYPFKDMPALPGVFVGMNETLDEAAKRGARDKAGVSELYFEQLYTWSDIDRDPRMRIISVSYISLTNADKLGNMSDNSALYDVDEILSGDTSLAFDHKRMIEYGRERIRNKVEYSDIAFEFVSEKFTLPQLQRVYEILLGKQLYKANFRKSIAEKISETEEMITGNAHRPSRLYRKRREIDIECFHEITEKNGFLSNWWPCVFKDEDGVEYCSNEQYMMYKKAMLFGDELTAEKILGETDPRTVQLLGREVRGFEQSLWNEHKYEIVKHGAELKFGQNPELMQKLMSFADNVIFAECSRSDRIWGTGIGMYDKKRYSRSEWTGKNYLGKIITEIRGNEYPETEEKEI